MFPSSFGIKDKWYQTGALLMLALCFVAYALSETAFFLVLPFGFLLVLATILNWKFIYWILIASLPVSIFLDLGPVSTTLPDEPLMGLFLMVFLVLYASNPKVLPEWWWRNPIVLIVVLQFVWLFIPFIFSEEKLISFKFIVAKSWFLASFFLLPIVAFRDKKDLVMAFKLLLVPMIISMFIIVARHAIAGLDFESVEFAIKPLYYNHVEYSTVISMFFPLVYIAWLLVDKRRPLLKLTLLFCVIFFLPAIYLTYARAAMLAVIFAFAVNIAIRMRLAGFIMPVFYAALIALLVFMVNNNKYIAFRPNYEKTYMHRDFADHIVATFRGTDMSSMERIHRWIAAIRMSQDRPITGYGPNSFYYYYKPYALPMFRTYVSRNEEKSTTHNYYLFMLVGQGVPAMLLYGVLVMVVFVQAQRIYYRFRDPFYKKVTMGVIMVFAAGFVNNFFSELIETHKVGALFYLSLAVLIILDRKSKQLSDREKSLLH
ncbi:MAG TPA: O-antigen ligase family protein [Flavipsychrobacter sp.]|nr:O-antigen ligase family protein [Flavipsychrobacter sp.]